LTNPARLSMSVRRSLRIMTITVDIAGAKARLSELVARAEAGEEIVIARDNVPVALLSRLPRADDIRAAIEEIRDARAGLPATGADEILQWRDEGRRF
jgi:prevent-host-death family protein